MKPEKLLTIACKMAAAAWVASAAPSLFAQGMPAFSEADLFIPQPAPQPEFERGRVAPQVALPVKIDLTGDVDVAGDHIYLGKIARCSGYSGLCDEADGVDLGPAPMPGKTQAVTRSWLAGVLAREWPGAHIEVVGKDVIHVRAAVQDIDADAVLREFRLAIQRKFEGREDFRVNVTRLQLSSSIKVRPGNYELRFPLLEAREDENLDTLAKDYVGMSNLEVRCVPEDDGERGEATFWATAQLSVERRLPVAVRNLAPRSILAAKDFEMAWVALGKSATQTLERLDSLAGMRLRSNIGVGQPVLGTQIEVPEAVAMGAFVRLIVRSGELEIAGRVKALAAGGVGQFIEVVYPETKKHLRARIVGQDAVEVVF